MGRETVAQDDPALTVRLVEGKSPLRIILDSKASLPLERKVFTDGAADTLLVVTPQAPQEKVRAFAALPGVSVLTAAERDGHVDLSDLMQLLAQKDVTSLLVEGGSKVHGAFLMQAWQRESMLSLHRASLVEIKAVLPLAVKAQVRWSRK